MTLTDEQLERYARHIVLKEIGGEGQKKLLSATVAIVGAGGIGSPLIQYLAAAGVGRLRIIDDDSVALSNLQRQTLFGTDDIGADKVARAAKAVARLNPDIVVETLDQRLTTENIESFLDAADVIVDGSDNFETRLLVADTACGRHIPLVSAAIGQFEGQLGTFRGWEPDKPCYRCFVGADPDRPDISCADQGVLGALAGIMGSMAAMETIRQITGFGEDTAGKLLLFDALSLRARTLTLPKDPGCPICAA
ncbi:HesA/MoeB/ThiF family protein [Parasphingopyxis algicola]|uniref:HesA/MoeB/ThiF family protein n=1 Tax=Parasphingopyxis algicola TaxID=2026624 RepID=UPI0015A333A6|nr:HesA/MoeB/ThiF family protein [Parasphingopyxis algicola]QLC24438.1 HesA/MoeB/ThiF family protein [Parasphingopyxis algicola]